MRTIYSMLGVVALVIAALLTFGFMSIDQTRPAIAPSVTVSGGQAPAFRADVANVQVGTEQKVIEVPKVEVQKPAGAPTNTPAQ